MQSEGSMHRRSEVFATAYQAMFTLRELTVADELREPLCHRCLAHSWLSHKAGVVLSASTQDLDHALNLLLPAYTGVKLPLGDDAKREW